MQSNQPHTFVVVTLDPPIRKGQTLYPHIVLQVCLLTAPNMVSLAFMKKKKLIYSLIIACLSLKQIMW